MSRWDAIGLFWEDDPNSRRARALGPMPSIPATDWRPPTEFPNIHNAPWISLDCETYDPELMDFGPGWARGKGHIVGVSVATNQGQWYFPIRHEVQAEMNMDAAQVMAWLAWSLAGDQPKIGANLMYDIGWLQQEGVIVNGPLYDVQYAEPLLDETSRVSLETLGRHYVGEGKDDSALKQWAMTYYGTTATTWRKDIYRCPVSMVGPYAEQDAALPYKVLTKQWPLLVNRGLLDLFYMECALIRVLMRMRFEGIAVDIPYAERLRDDLIVRRDIAQKEAEHILGMSVNQGSGESLAKAFNHLGLKYPQTANGNPSFKKDFLKTVKHPFVERILQVRELEKLRGTFVESYLLQSNVRGKIHCSFHPLMGESGGAKTGRLSSSSPCLQNIPSRTSEGKALRKAFIPDAGHVQIKAYDYSQVEYRMLMHFATGQGADEFRDRYWNDPTLDFHKMCGQIVQERAGVELERSYIKNVNFGIVYGVGIAHLAEILGVNRDVAEQILNHYHGALPFVKSTMNATMGEVGATGICTTILNRQTHFDQWEPSGFNNRNGEPLAYHAALNKWGPNIMRAYLYKSLNYRLQGSAAEIMKKAMVQCAETGVFDETGFPRLTVHDELVFSDTGQARPQAWAEMQHIMENCIPCKVPIKAEMKSALHWGDCK